MIAEDLPLHRELFLTHFLKTLYMSYRFYKLIAQPQLALKYITNASEVVSSIIQPSLFVSSAELSKIAA